MNKTLVYLYDPLCGWCYGAGGPLPQVLESTCIALRLIPTGLFSGSGARAMDDDFAAYAWSNDQRIERLTGQVFSERYRDQVLADRLQGFDSAPSTLALSAVSLTSPEHEFEALKAIQAARYVDGLDVTRLETLTAVLADLGLDAAAQRWRVRIRACCRPTMIVWGRGVPCCVAWAVEACRHSFCNKRTTPCSCYLPALSFQIRRLSFAS